MVRQQAVHGHKTRPKSDVWKYFDYLVVPGKTAKATCKRCASTLSACKKKHGTSQLWRHAKSSCCAKRAAERAAPCLPAPALAGAGNDEEDVPCLPAPAAEPAGSGEDEEGLPCLTAPAAVAAGGGDDDDDKEALGEWDWVDSLIIEPGLFVVNERLVISGSTTDSAFTDGCQVDGGGEVAAEAAGDHDRRFPNFMPDTRMPQAQSSSSVRFFEKKRARFSNFASHQGGTTEKDHSSRVNTDWVPTVGNSMVDTDFTFGVYRLT